MSDQNHSERTNRRKVLKTVSAIGGVAALGTAQSSIVSAATRPRPTSEREKRIRKQNAEASREKYATIGAVQSALEAHASELLAGLSEKGYLQQSVASEVVPAQISNIEEFVETEEGATVTAVPEGSDGFEPHIIVTKRVKNGLLKIFVQPESKNSYAAFEPDDGDKQLLRPSSDSVTIQKTCVTENYCIENYGCCAPCGCNVGICHRMQDVYRCDDGTCDWGDMDDCCRYPDYPPC